MAAAMERGGFPVRYEYSDRPLREETIQEIRNGDGISAVFTRNSYGAIVLNTNRVMFVNVDVYRPSYTLSFGELVRETFGMVCGANRQP